MTATPTPNASTDRDPDAARNRRFAHRDLVRVAVEDEQIDQERRRRSRSTTATQTHRGTSIKELLRLNRWVQPKVFPTRWADPPGPGGRVDDVIALGVLPFGSVDCSGPGRAARRARP